MQIRRREFGTCFGCSFEKGEVYALAVANIGNNSNVFGSFEFKDIFLEAEILLS